ncbi:CPBP family intramembrane glutamic endopeptidase [Paenibacillus sp. ALE1]
MFVKNSNPQGLTSISSNEIYISLVTDILAGAEEVWRYSSILVIYLLLNYAVGKLNKGKNIKIALLMISFIVSSFLFGWMHTFAYSDGWINPDITIMIGLMGLCFASIMFITKRIWSVILTHIVFDVYNTFNSYDRTIVNSILIVACLSVSIILLLTKRKGKTEIEI